MNIRTFLGPLLCTGLLALALTMGACSFSDGGVGGEGSGTSATHDERSSESSPRGVASLTDTSGQGSGTSTSGGGTTEGTRSGAPGGSSTSSSSRTSSGNGSSSSSSGPSESTSTPCTPGDLRCSDGDEEAIERCDAQGLWDEIEETCGAEERCAFLDDEYICGTFLCDPGSERCSESREALIRCDNTGLDEDWQDCGEDRICDPDADACVDQVCAPSSRFCDDDRAMQCDALGLDSNEVDVCEANVSRCEAGFCELLECTPGATRCNAAATGVLVCVADGSGETVQENCGALSRRCETGVAGAICGSCADGYVERDGECELRITCSDLDCGDRNRVCDAGGPGVDASCGGCLIGYVNRAGSCEPKVRCNALGCTASNRVCITGGPNEDDACGGCFEGYDEVDDQCLPPIGIPGGVEATQGDFEDRVEVTWDAVEDASGYHVYRDDLRITSTPVTERFVADTLAPPGGAPPKVTGVSTESFPDAVRINWPALQPPTGDVVQYRITAVVDGVEGSPSGPAPGFRAARPIQRYEIRFGSAGWIDVGTSLAYLDTGASEGGISLDSISVSTDNIDGVELSVPEPTFDPGFNRFYRVRATNASGVGEESDSAAGARVPANPSYQWQHANAPSAQFQNLAGATSRTHFDTTLAPGTHRWYRVRVTAEGTNAVRTTGSRRGTRYIECIEDAQSPNHTRTAAYATSYGTRMEGVLCLGQEDWFRFDADPGDTVTISLEYIHFNGPLRLDLQDASGSFLDDDWSSNNNAEITYQVPAQQVPGARYYVRVWAFPDGHNDYALTISR